MSKTIQQTLTQIQSELNVPKKRFNSFGKYTYRNLEDIYESLKPIIKKNDVNLTLQDDIVCVSDRVYVKATATLCKGDQSVQVSAMAREPYSKKGMDDSQITGTASSYARKYALAGLFLLDDVKDPDTNEFTQQTRQNPKNKVVKRATNTRTSDQKDAMLDDLPF